MPEATVRHVFVYGTLRKGERNDIHRLSPAPRFVGTGKVKGLLHLVSWYPGLVLGGEGEVFGEVYEITPELELRLDEIEEVHPEPTNEYFKREITVHVDGRAIECLVYEINPERVEGKAFIASGDWIARH
ncbi:MAG: gamma-glutamylcyclotransferase [Comamonadaceae bacterium]|nr:MAG: gamma-glutamylcyclotransferase [Comamonadaceae bacterium]